MNLKDLRFNNCIFDLEDGRPTSYSGAREHGIPFPETLKELEETEGYEPLVLPEGDFVVQVYPNVVDIHIRDIRDSRGFSIRSYGIIESYDFDLKKYIFYYTFDIDVMKFIMKTFEKVRESEDYVRKNILFEGDTTVLYLSDKKDYRFLSWKVYNEYMSDEEYKSDKLILKFNNEHLVIEGGREISISSFNKGEYFVFPETEDEFISDKRIRKIEIPENGYRVFLENIIDVHYRTLKDNGKEYAIVECYNGKTDKLLYYYTFDINMVNYIKDVIIKVKNDKEYLMNNILFSKTYDPSNIQKTILEIERLLSGELRFKFVRYREYFEIMDAYRVLALNKIRVFTVQDKSVVELLKSGRVYTPNFKKSNFVKENPELIHLYNEFYDIYTNLNSLPKIENPGLVFGFIRLVEGEGLRSIFDFREFINENRAVIKSLWESFKKGDKCILELEVDMSKLNIVPIDINDFQYLTPPFNPFSLFHEEEILAPLRKGMLVKGLISPCNVWQVHLHEIDPSQVVGIYDMID